MPDLRPTSRRAAAALAAILALACSGRSSGGGGDHAGGSSGGGATAPSITADPASQTAAVGDPAAFDVAAAGTDPLVFQWRLGGAPISGATSATLTLPSVQLSDAGTYTVTVSNSAGAVTSNPATLTVIAPGSNARYALAGFATTDGGTTGGGELAETDAAYVKVTTPLELATAIARANKTAGAVKVIEIMNDLDLGWNEVGAAVQTLASTPFRQHATPLLHPVLLSSGVSIVDVKAKSGLTIFSANGSTLRHATLNVKGTSNIIIRNLRFDELWEWDESTKGNYDRNDWDFIDLGNGSQVHHVWIDHCTFTKAYDGILDIKGGSYAITLSWNRYVGDDGATGGSSFVRKQLAALEASACGAGCPMYTFLRASGFTVDDIAAIHRGHDKTHLIGATELSAENALFTVTMHHLWFQNPWDRLPRLRAGNVHAYDLYVDDSAELAAHYMRDARAAALSSAAQGTLNGTYNFDPPLNGSISTEGGAVLIEKSVYLDSLWPLRNNQKDPANAAYTGKIAALDTLYVFHDAAGVATTVRGNSTDAGNPLGPSQAAIIPFSWSPPAGTSWTSTTALPYSYTTDDPASLQAILSAGAGAGVLTWPKANWLKTSY
jgi:pectate lyase